MGKDKKKKGKKPTQEDTSDAEISDNGDNITNDTTTQHFPRFLLIGSIEENRNITSLSPFVIQKVILGIAGEPEKPLGIKLSALPRPWGLNSHWERC